MLGKKRGQGMSINTIIMLILAVIVLVVLILGFTLGWDKVSPWVSKQNVNDIVTSCDAACSTNSQYDFCSVDKELRDESKNKYKTTCAVFSSVSDFSKYGIEKCSFECTGHCADVMINGKAGSLAATIPADHYDVSSLADDTDATITPYCVIAK